MRWPDSNSTETPNHALQRTATAVTAPASCLRLSPTMQGPRQPPPSLSLGSFGKNMKTLMTLALLALLQVPGDAAEIAPIEAAPVGQASITVSPKDSAFPGKRWKTRKFQIKNTSSKDFFVYGHSLENVFIQVFTKEPDSGKWVSRELGYCGTGAGPQRLKSGSAFVALVSLPVDIADREFVIEFTRHSDALDEKGELTKTQPLSMKTSP